MTYFVDHIALLVNELSPELLCKFPYPQGEKQGFEAEGTEEIYIGPPEAQALLLLLAPMGEGPYLRALKKRGLGLHHIALGVSDFEAYHQRLCEMGWQLHPQSLNAYTAGQTVFYARAGVHTLLEVIPQTALLAGPPFVTAVDIPTEKHVASLITGLNLPHLRPVEPGGFRLSIAEESWGLDALLGPQDALC